MCLSITSLNSGSNGNCYYVGNDDEAVLVDAGISCREIERRMKRLQLDMHRIKAVFISHEHTDHISGLPSLVRKYKVPVYITPDTLYHGRLQIDRELVQSFRAYQPIQVGKLSVVAFPKYHDASDPHSFMVCCNDVRIGIFTDIGGPCEHVIHQFSQCHAAFLEANYDETMLSNGSYPIFLKNRIRGGRGHLSNRQALELFLKHRPAFMSHLVLSHLSKENNSPQLVYELFSADKENTQIIVASRYEETPVFRVLSKSPATSYRVQPYFQPRPVQLRLFDLQ
jgi:phosphoribosyl 1,2-cyclic phosphodiesterase